MTPKQKLTTLITVLALTTANCIAQTPQWPMAYPPIHDPVAAYCDGTWYMFSTSFGIDILSSQDLKTWNHAGRVFEQAPQWAVETVPGYHGHTWAPDILYHDGMYYLYYSCSSFGKNTSAIGVATNRTLNPLSPDYKWEDIYGFT